MIPKQLTKERQDHEEFIKKAYDAYAEPDNHTAKVSHHVSNLERLHAEMGHHVGRLKELQAEEKHKEDSQEETPAEAASGTIENEE